jgi:hypothetical protein
MFSKMALYTSSLYTLSTSPKIRVFFKNERKWNTVSDINSNEWKQIYILPFTATACTKLHWFQFRIKEIITPLYFKKFTQNPNLFEN